ncbi:MULTISPECIES: ATP phosphoribosyltransferase [Allobacillus]|uniref:ATP phosphoribosyltransferase n=1 Tax=Allobacillus halotolerans TaxID=570278 RepID=A0ABS6GKV0_9BACI|nr:MULTISPECIES: ATP phosphoribosyltransferase [Allobacillus]MBU6079716.1 ATP phosphoribosyltransferase [Allobacillus halotolerans]TSJ68243.1 ATP phosphoribosyltransferase [Allobacillus sp. SKP2-8]
MEVIKIALAKGRLAEKSVDLFESIGVVFSQFHEESRKLIFKSDHQQFEMILVKATDVATYVENGAADIGVAGKDTLLESEADVYEVIDLGFGKCRFAVAGKEDTDLNGMIKPRIASKYPKVTTDYFEQKGKQIETIKLNGSVELAPLVGLSDAIVDIVETGGTLKENGLVVLEDMVQSSARLICNKASFKTKGESIQPFIENVQDMIKQSEGEKANA